MDPLHMIELRPDLQALLRFLQGQDLATGHGDDDLGYGVHAWLAAAFGPMGPQPWRLLLDKRRPPRILGYSHQDAGQLQQRLSEFAEPAAGAVCPPDAISSRAMPVWHTGRRLAFEVQCCPMGRKARSGTEKDLFLMQADIAGGEPLERPTVYGEWVRERLQRERAAAVTMIQLSGFRLVRLTRQQQGGSGPRRRCHPLRPQALLRGELTVTDPEAFSRLLAHGVGRHRSFGYGMLLLRPPS